MVIAYHGTSAINAESIQREGFRPETWFAFEREHAVRFGGQGDGLTAEVVFTVEFLDDPRYWHGGGNPADAWQFHLRGWLSPDAIRRIEPKNWRTAWPKA